VCKYIKQFCTIRYTYTHAYCTKHTIAFFFVVCFLLFFCIFCLFVVVFFFWTVKQASTSWHKKFTYYHHYTDVKVTHLALKQSPLNSWSKMPYRCTNQSDEFIVSIQIHLHCELLTHILPTNTILLEIILNLYSPYKICPDQSRYWLIGKTHNPVKIHQVIWWFGWAIWWIHRINSNTYYTTWTIDTPSESPNHLMNFDWIMCFAD
jgi:hypothetical protein